ncbi:hypothetical protein [Parvularcula sp. IMCC14364]|uniref:hypothetical protein n=1 Tax=Parvularcula sp. IMCC14364 TaxID=3067902 RepID=UPI0027411136|nr:hypothetical protein [Parvularcula sp. IMCC14364]
MADTARQLIFFPSAKHQSRWQSEPVECPAKKSGVYYFMQGNSDKMFTTDNGILFVSAISSGNIEGGYVLRSAAGSDKQWVLENNTEASIYVTALHFGTPPGC